MELAYENVNLLVYAIVDLIKYDSDIVLGRYAKLKMYNRGINMENLREKAKELRNSQNYKEAIVIYKKIINNSSLDKLDKWIGWEYADSLKRNNQLDEAIAVAKEIYIKYNDFEYIKYLLSWSLYEKYFKNLDVNQISKLDIKQLCRIGSFILKITKQEKKLPYENTVCKISKVLENIDFNNELEKYNTIYKWIDKLDVDKLSKNSVVIKINQEREIEKASLFEEMLYLKIKCLFKLESYEMAKNISMSFLEQDIKFHNDRDKWIKRIIANCEWNLNNKECAIKALHELDQVFNHWVINYEISIKEYNLDNLDEALYYASKGILGNEPMEKKKSLLKLQSKILNDIGKDEERKYVEEYCSSLESNVDDKKVLKNKIIEISKSSMEISSGRRSGIVSKILSNNKAGFIQSGRESFYFKKKNVFSKNIIEKNNVSFKVIKSFDMKKNKETLEAIDIIIKL